MPQKAQANAWAFFDKINRLALASTASFRYYNARFRAYSSVG